MYYYDFRVLRQLVCVRSWYSGAGGEFSVWLSSCGWVLAWSVGLVYLLMLWFFLFYFCSVVQLRI